MGGRRRRPIGSTRTRPRVSKIIKSPLTIGYKNPVNPLVETIVSTTTADKTQLRTDSREDGGGEILAKGPVCLKITWSWERESSFRICTVRTRRKGLISRSSHPCPFQDMMVTMERVRAWSCPDDPEILIPPPREFKSSWQGMCFHLLVHFLSGTNEWMHSEDYGILNWNCAGGISELWNLNIALLTFRNVWRSKSPVVQMFRLNAIFYDYHRRRRLVRLWVLDAALLLLKNAGEVNFPGF